MPTLIQQHQSGQNVTDYPGLIAAYETLARESCVNPQPGSQQVYRTAKDWARQLEAEAHALEADLNFALRLFPWRVMKRGETLSGEELSQRSRPLCEDTPQMQRLLNSLRALVSHVTRRPDGQLTVHVQVRLR